MSVPVAASDVVEVWDSVAPNAVPEGKFSPHQQHKYFYSTGDPQFGYPPAKKPYPPNVWLRPPPPPTPKPVEPAASQSVWPDILGYFNFGSSISSSSSSTPETKTSPRPTVPVPKLPYPPPHRPPQHRPRKRPQKITVTSASQNGTMHHKDVTMHHLSSDEQLTILKVDEHHDNQTNVEENSLDDQDSIADHDNEDKDDNATNGVEGDPEKSHYLVLHKLHNGDALNLENLQTYSSMADVEDGIIHDAEEKSFEPPPPPGLYNGGGHDQPRDLLDDHDQFVLPPAKDLVIAERPHIEQEIYEPIPLDQLEDLEAMPDQRPPPVYIIGPPYPLRGDQNISGEVEPPTEEEVEEALRQANLELFKLTTEGRGNFEATGVERDKRLLPGLIIPDTIQNTKNKNGDDSVTTSLSTESTTSPSTTTTTTTTPPSSTTSTSENPFLDNDAAKTEIDKADFFESQTVVYDFNWTPLPPTTRRPTFGPSPAPKNYTIKLEDIDELSGLALVTLDDNGKLAEQIRKRRNETASEATNKPPVVNVQLLPPRLSAVLYHVSEKHRALSGPPPPPGSRYSGSFRQNKIAPAFKYDPAGIGVGKHGRSIRHPFDFHR